MYSLSSSRIFVRQKAPAKWHFHAATDAVCQCSSETVVCQGENAWGSVARVGRSEGLGGGAGAQSTLRALGDLAHRRAGGGAGHDATVCNMKLSLLASITGLEGLQMHTYSSCSTPRHSDSGSSREPPSPSEIGEFPVYLMYVVVLELHRKEDLSDSGCCPAIPCFGTVSPKLDGPEYLISRDLVPPRSSFLQSSLQVEELQYGLKTILSAVRIDPFHRSH